MEEVIEKIRGRLAAVDPNGPRKVVGVFQINIECEDGTKNYVCDLRNLTFSEGVADEPDVTLETDETTFVQTSKREISFAEAQASGKTTVTGDLALVLALTEVMKCTN